MLRIYLVSIIIWMIIIFCTIQLFKFKIVENGWLELKSDQVMNPFMVLFLTSAVPLVRLLMFVCTIYMAIYTKEQYEELKEDREKDDE